VTRRAVGLATAVTVVALLAASACTGDSEPPEPVESVPGVSSAIVTIGSTQPLTGVVTASYGEISRASAAYFKYVNDHGGINGRFISYKYVDDRYDPKQTARRTRALVRDKNVFAVFNGLGTATHQRVVDFLNRRQVPDVFVGSGCPCWDRPRAHPFTFGWQPSSVAEGKILGRYIAKKFHKKKVGVFYQNDDFGRAGLKGIRQSVPHKRIVSARSYNPANTRITKQVRALQSAGADVVVSFSLPAYSAILKLNMLKLRYDPRLVVSSVGSDPNTLARLLQVIATKAGFKVNGVRLMQGVVTDGFLPAAGDRHNSWVQLFRDIHARYIPTLEFDGNVVYGMAAAYTFTQALQAAGPDLTRDGLVAAIERGLPAGPGLVPFGFSAFSHGGYTGAQVGVIRGRTIDYVGAPQTTDDGDGRVSSYNKPPADAPAGGIPDPPERSE
jgi:ABC-type branched-subunit amino acid transport system substrate-binding protein